MKKTFSVINRRIKISKEKISDLKIYQRKLKIETQRKRVLKMNTASLHCAKM